MIEDVIGGPFCGITDISSAPQSYSKRLSWVTILLTMFPLLCFLLGHCLFHMLSFTQLDPFVVCNISWSPFSLCWPWLRTDVICLYNCLWEISVPFLINTLYLLQSGGLAACLEACSIELLFVHTVTFNPWSCCFLFTACWEQLALIRLFTGY